MSKRPGHVEVVTETGYCNFCGRTRNLRREEHHLGAIVRTIITCESCHRTLSSSIGVAPPETAAAEKPAEVEAKAAEPARATAKPTVAKAAPAAAKKAAPKKAPANKPAATKPATKKPAAKSAGTRTGKPTSTATRKTTRTK